MRDQETHEKFHGGRGEHNSGHGIRASSENSKDTGRLLRLDCNEAKKKVSRNEIREVSRLCLALTKSIKYILGFVLSGSGSPRRFLAREEHDLVSILTGYL